MEPTTPQVIDYLIKLALGGLLIWGVKTIHSLVVEVKALRVALFGIEGANGINSEVKIIRELVTEHDEFISFLKGRDSR